ncbi:hypothetical protein [Microbaculum sp. FT89]|uniref:hypothetical protein n=1 Tax=Microbaculum sp. FT89 TaxID=3447298 RepID=UPI003F53CC65
MLDIVAAHQHQPPLGIDVGRVHHGQPVLLGAQGPAESAPPRRDATDDPRGHRDQQQHEDEGDDESRRQSQLDP